MEAFFIIKNRLNCQTTSTWGYQNSSKRPILCSNFLPPPGLSTIAFNFSHLEKLLWKDCGGEIAVDRALGGSEKEAEELLPEIKNGLNCQTTPGYDCLVFHKLALLFTLFTLFNSPLLKTLLHKSNSSHHNFFNYFICLNSIYQYFCVWVVLRVFQLSWFKLK